MPPDPGGAYPYVRPVNQQNLGPEVPRGSCWGPRYGSDGSNLVLWGHTSGKKAALQRPWVHCQSNIPTT